jgi:hypothetical protein
MGAESFDPAAFAADKGVSALGGTISGGASGYFEGKKTKREMKEYIKQQEALGNTISATMQKRLLENTSDYAPQLQNYDANLQRYQADAMGSDLSKYDVAAPGEFEYDMEAATQAALNPAIKDIIRASTDEVQQSAANRGSLFSGAALKGIANSTATIQANERARAQQVAQQGYTNKYQAFQDKFTNTLNAAQNNKGNFQTGLQNRQGVVNMQNTAQNDMLARKQGVTDAGDTAMIQNQSNIGTAKAKKAGVGSNFENIVGGALQGLGSALGGQ